MPEVEVSRFTVGVFKDVAWAKKGLEALKRNGFPASALTVLAKESPDVSQLISESVGTGSEKLELPGIGGVLAQGPLVAALQGADRGLTRLGIAGTMRRVGFQAHDGRIFDSLVGRGGVLVGVIGESRVSDALEVLLSYGGGNAAIGAWTGRV